MHVLPYTSTWGSLVADWVTSGQDLQWLAPSTLPPLTGEKVTAWKKAGGAALLGFEEHSAEPIAYGEVNPMRSETGHFWIGHIIVSPHLRGCGVGRLFVRGLLEEAFGKQQARRVSLVVFPDNLVALQCYKQSGFRVVGDERHRFLPGGPRHRLLRLEADPGVFTAPQSQPRAQPLSVVH